MKWVVTVRSIYPAFPSRYFVMHYLVDTSCKDEALKLVYHRLGTCSSDCSVLLSAEHREVNSLVFDAKVDTLLNLQPAYSG